MRIETRVSRDPAYIQEEHQEALNAPRPGLGMGEAYEDLLLLLSSLIWSNKV